MPPLALRVAARFVASTTHYRYDEGVVHAQLHTLNNPEARAESDAEFGGHNEYRFELVPLSHISVPPVWHKDRIEKVRAAIAAGVALPPVQLTEHEGRLHIDDGIHRTNASLESGFTTVPALVHKWVEVPGARRKVEPEKPQLPEGAWVRLRKPYHEDSVSYVFGYVAERLGPGHEHGVKRWRYQIALVVPGVDWPNFVDMQDTAFDPTSAPSWGRHLH
jgi:hypothetical protein